MHPRHWLLILMTMLVPFQAVALEMDTISLGGELRLRSETLVNFSAFVPTRTATADDSFVLLRARPYLKATPIKGLAIFLQPQFSRGFAQEESTLANGVNVDDFDLHQGYLDMLKIGDSPVSLRLGRQELAYGSERLLGALGWSNVGRSHDAAKLRLEWERVWIDTFFSWIQRAGGNQYLAGSYGHWNITPTLADEPYVLFMTDRDGAAGGQALDVYTLGNRFAGTFGRGWDADLEAALQLGKSAGNTIVAYFAHAGGGYTFTPAAKPRIGVEYNLASGDPDPAAGRVRTFNQLFPSNHDKYGFMDIVGLRNIHNPRVTLEVTPLKNLTASLDYHLFFLMHPADGLYQASGAQLRAGAAGASRFVGHEIDCSLKYRWNPYVQFLAGYSFLKAGNFLADTGIQQDAHFAYAQTHVSF